MPDLGQYAGPVLAAYGVGLFLLIGLTVWSLNAAKSSKKQLEELEARRKKNG